MAKTQAESKIHEDKQQFITVCLELGCSSPSGCPRSSFVLERFCDKSLPRLLKTYQQSFKFLLIETCQALQYP
jgi:hypothetical protein